MAGMRIRAVSDERFERSVKETAGRGRACLRGWPQVCIAVVIKRTHKKRVVEITRKVVQGTLEHAQALLSASGGGTELNTAFIERLNGTMRQRLASLTRTCRHAARRLAALESGMWPASLYLQSLLAPSRIEPTCRQGPRRRRCRAAHSSHGQWLDRSRLERPGTLELSRGSLALGCTKATRTT